MYCDYPVNIMLFHNCMTRQGHHCTLAHFVEQKKLLYPRPKVFVRVRLHISIGLIVMYI